jgi:2-keto-3-deoxy-galactonokinase
LFENLIREDFMEREPKSALQALRAKSSHEWHAAAVGHNLNRAARVSKRMFDTRAGELPTDLRRSVIWT